MGGGECGRRGESRALGVLADSTAGARVAGRAIVQSWIKIGADSNYRTQSEGKLVEDDQRQSDALGIAQYVASGLAPYADSDDFLEEMKSANVPHPFDTHPSLDERMRNVVVRIDEKEFGRIAASVPAESWVTDILNAQGIEQRLWADYEKKFAAVHEQNLSYRYEPANEAERAIVLKYFPPVTFELKGGKRIALTYAGPILPEQTETLSWDKVTKLNYVDGFGGDLLRIEHPEKGWLGAKTTKVKLPGIKKERARFKEVLGRYWQRHQYMRQQMAHKA